MKKLYIVNPTAGRGRAQKVWQRLLSTHGEIENDYHITAFAGEAEQVAQKASASGYEAVIAVGGDGTLHEVVNGAIRSDTPLVIGHIPCGTGNDFARSFRLPLNPENAWLGCQQGDTVMVDLGTINDRFFINVAGFGFDAAVAAEVTRRAAVSKMTGTIPYLMAVVKLIRTYRPHNICITLDGEEISGPVFLGAIGNGSTYGGGMQICPGAECYDGYFNVCLAGDFNRFEALVNLTRVFTGSHTNHEKCLYRPAKHIVVHGTPDVLVHADGQMIGTLPIHVRMIPQAIAFLHPDASHMVAKEVRQA